MLKLVFKTCLKWGHLHTCMHAWYATSALTLLHSSLRDDQELRDGLASLFFFPSNYHSKENIFLSNMGVMLFQVWVMNKLVQTLHVSELMQKKTTDWWWVLSGSRRRGATPGQSTHTCIEYELIIQRECCLDLLDEMSPWCVHPIIFGEVTQTSMGIFSKQPKSFFFLNEWLITHL